MNRAFPVRLLSLAMLAALSGCSGGSGGGDPRVGADFIVLQTSPIDNGTLFLNEPIAIDFSNEVNLDTVDLTTFSFAVLDQAGNSVNEAVAGRFEIRKTPGDAADGRRLVFVPKLPTNDLFTDGGFRPGRTYRVQLVGGDRVNGTIIRDRNGRALAEPRSFRFSTADGVSTQQLFRNPLPGGPRRAGLTITPTPDATGVVLNKIGSPPVEVRLVFDQPLNPSSTNVPVALNTDPLVRSPNSRGRIYLAYDDPDLGENIWIPADVELESNTLETATVVLRPLGVLPNNATVKVIVERTLEDISGESNLASAAFEREFGTFRTRRAYEQQFDGLVEEFNAGANVDFGAAFAEPQAEVGPTYVRAGFEFEGSATGADYVPQVPLSVLNTNFTQITVGGQPLNVSDGVFNFRNVTIPANREVRGVGSNPMVWLVSGTMTVEGILSVRGGNADPVTSVANANVPKRGGVGACTGGDGGAGSPSAIGRDTAGATGNGPLQTSGGGGVGGDLFFAPGCGRGAGGGGGALATQGDPNYKVTTQPPSGTQAFPVFPQVSGVGGSGGCGPGGEARRQLVGGAAGPSAFTDSRQDNNFWGAGVRFSNPPLRIVGELAVPIGGSGGGGGGDLSFNASSGPDPNFASDSSGGGGGGGGGVLIVKALGRIVIAPGGRITADGGNGRGGEPESSSQRGGGGGGGAGGMVILISATGIDINARGSAGRFRYAGTGTDTNDYDFSISADGGICTTLNQAPVVSGKYPTSGTAFVTTSTNPNAWFNLYDSAPLGGYGGMGIVQLMAPAGTPGVPSTDGTNTILDDNIRLFRAGVLVTDAEVKKNLLAWQGFRDSAGVGRDDSGVQITVGEGDIRPAPILLPSPLGARTRLRSRWIDTGSSDRRALVVDDGRPRGIVEQGGDLRGPTYEFEGINSTTGFTNYQLVGSVARPLFRVVAGPAVILTVNGNSSFLDRPAYRVDLASSALGTTVDRYTQYEAELLNDTGSVLGSFRILSHTDRELVLSPETGALPTGATSVRVVAKFFDITTNNQPGLGTTYAPSPSAPTVRVPYANVQIGFAFHRDPKASTGRVPPTGYIYNLDDPAVRQAVREQHAPFVQWELVFDRQFSIPTLGPAPGLTVDTPRPQLNFLRLPFRF